MLHSFSGVAKAVAKVKGREDGIVTGYSGIERAWQHPAKSQSDGVYNPSLHSIVLIVVLEMWPLEGY